MLFHNQSPQSQTLDTLWVRKYPLKVLARHNYTTPRPRGPQSPLCFAFLLHHREGVICFSWLYSTWDRVLASHLRSGLPALVGGWGSASSTSQVPFTTATQTRETSETTFLGCTWQDLKPSWTPVPYPGHFEQRAWHMQEFRSEKKTGMTMEQVRHYGWWKGIWQRREMEWKCILGLLLVVKGFTLKVQSQIIKFANLF